MNGVFGILPDVGCCVISVDTGDSQEVLEVLKDLDIMGIGVFYIRLCMF